MHNDKYNYSKYINNYNEMVKSLKLKYILFKKKKKLLKQKTELNQIEIEFDVVVSDHKKTYTVYRFLSF